MNSASGPIPELYHLPCLHEPFSALSHLLGAAAFLVLGLFLLQRGRGDRSRLLFLGAYACSCVLLLTLSGVYHLLARGSPTHQVMGRLDRGAIFILIAGTFTPAHGLLFRGWLRWGPLLLVWAAALAGILLRTVFSVGLPEWLGLALYLGFGWFGGYSAALLWRRHGFTFIRPLVWGGVAYSAGGVVEYLGGLVLIPGVVHPHEVLHLAVLAGACCHWRFVWQFAAGGVRLA